jgi:hypothetical protein
VPNFDRAKERPFLPTTEVVGIPAENFMNERDPDVIDGMAELLWDWNPDDEDTAPHVDFSALRAVEAARRAPPEAARQCLTDIICAIHDGGDPARQLLAVKAALQDHGMGG